MGRWILILAVLGMAGTAWAGEEEAARGWMGVQVRELDEAARTELGYEGEAGILIEAIFEDSPAGKAGLRPGDIIFRVGRFRLPNVPALMEAMSDTRHGQKLGFAAWRLGKAFEGHIELGHRPAETAEAREEVGPEEARRRVDRHLDELTEALMRAAEEGNRGAIRELVHAIREASMQAAWLQSRIREGEHEARGGAERERAAAREQVEVIRMAMHAMLEADRHDLAEALEQKIHAIELALEGRRDPEAIEIMKRAPGVGDMAELLNHAAEFYRKHEMPERAQACARLGGHYLERFRAGQKERAGREAAAEGAEHIRHLQNRLRELAEELERLNEDMNRVRRGLEK